MMCSRVMCQNKVLSLMESFVSKLERCWRLLKVKEYILFSTLIFLSAILK